MNPVSNGAVITEKNYPITTLWIFKAPLIIFVVSIVAILFGIWFPYLILAMIFMLIANPLRRRNFHYALEDKYVVVNQGVLSKQQRNLPYGVIQQVFVQQDIFDRLFGLASLSIENASQGGGSAMSLGNIFKGNKAGARGETIGASGNKVSIPGLTKPNAEALKAIILAKMKANPVEDSQSGL